MHTNQNLSGRRRHTKFSGIFEIQTDHPVTARILDLVFVNKKKFFKKNCQVENLTVPAEETEKVNNYLDLLES